MKVYGEGSIQQVDKHISRYKCRKWRLFVKTEDGMRTRRFDGTLREAKAELRDFIDDLAVEIPCHETFGTYADQWMKERRESGDYSPNTVSRDAVRVRALKREFGGDKLSDITPQRVRTGLSEIRNSNNVSGCVLSGTYANCLHATLRLILAQALVDGLIAANPCDTVKRPKKDTPEKEAADNAKLSDLLDKLDDEPLDGRVMAVYLITCLGLRRGEACGLYWEDVTGDCVNVKRAMREADGSIDKPKTTAGIRSLPMPARLARKMAVWRVVAAYNGFSGDTVCIASNGKPLRPQNLWKWWEQNRSRFGMDGITLHQLRHSNLTIMARKCRSVFDLQYWAGWASIEPAKIYIHRDDAELKRASALLDF